MIELEPCPFCGNPVTEKSFGGRGETVTELTVACFTCGYILEIDTSEFVRDFPPPDAFSIWNRRSK